jgi:hypothetical protein
MNRPTNDFNKLPKWARDYIGTLERAHHDSEQRLRQLYEQPKSNTFECSHVRRPFYLEKNARVRFELNADFYFDVQLDRDCFNNPALSVMARDGIVVQPGASNCVTLRPSR